MSDHKDKDLTPREDRQIAGVYTLAPEAMLMSTVRFTLSVAHNLLRSDLPDSLIRLGGDPRLTERAAGMIIRTMLRAMVSREEPTPVEFRRLVGDLIELARSH